MTKRITELQDVITRIPLTRVWGFSFFVREDRRKSAKHPAQQPASQGGLTPLVIIVPPPPSQALGRTLSVVISGKSRIRNG